VNPERFTSDQARALRSALGYVAIRD
jgi:hypothetical protein